MREPGQAFLTKSPPTRHAPVPPGASRVDVRYRLPTDATPVRFARSFERPVPTVSLYVADTGLELRSERLHRRRCSQ